MMLRLVSLNNCPVGRNTTANGETESMDVPDSVKALRQEILDRRGVKLDDIEFTFIKGMWSRLGEATLMNRIKSHPDVGERWYPELLKKIRAQQAEDARQKELADASKQNGSIQPQAQTLQAH